MEPYLTGEIRSLFDAWHARLRERFERDLAFPEIRKGVQALSSIYVGRRGRLPGGGAALEGAGKRAAFALFYAPIHFLIAWHVVKEIEFDALPFARLWDLGCGTGVAGAAWGAAARLTRQAGAPPRIVGVDRSGSLLPEAEFTYRAFGVAASMRRIDLASSSAAAPIVAIGAPLHRVGDEHEIPRAGASRRRSRPALSGARRGQALGKNDAVLLGWALNELAMEAREGLLGDIMIGRGTNRPLLILEPIAKRVAPWWPRWESALGEEALLLHSFEWRRRLDLPPWIAEMDRAAGLDHSELTTRVLGAVG